MLLSNRVILLFSGVTIVLICVVMVYFLKLEGIEFGAPLSFVLPAWLFIFFICLSSLALYWKNSLYLFSKMKDMRYANKFILLIVYSRIVPLWLVFCIVIFLGQSGLDMIYRSIIFLSLLLPLVMYLALIEKWIRSKGIKNHNRGAK